LWQVNCSYKQEYWWCLCQLLTPLTSPYKSGCWVLQCSSVFQIWLQICKKFLSWVTTELKQILTIKHYSPYSAIGNVIYKCINRALDFPKPWHLCPCKASWSRSYFLFLLVLNSCRFLYSFIILLPIWSFCINIMFIIVLIQWFIMYKF
jgi:hypothetical protein